jgi:hypothetical protein
MGLIADLLKIVSRVIVLVVDKIVKSPIIFALFISYSIGGIFNNSLYNKTVNLKNIPFLKDSIPISNQ